VDNREREIGSKGHGCSVIEMGGWYVLSGKKSKED